ncbi:MBL fold metallo-hydrolase, partial [Candidatus Pacearchaeota archaeon]|nr:MBL fold metallo-hydrolase [Candidatus Pacearchaeota archaeon]
MKKHIISVLAILVINVSSLGIPDAYAQLLEVKPDKSAIVKDAPTGTAKQLVRLSAGTRVSKVGEVPRYYSIRLTDGKIGWSYKGNFVIVEDTEPNAVVTKESLLARSDVLKIIVIDVEVGDATLIICPSENGHQDIILIDTGEDDSDRIRQELISNGFILSSKPISRFFITHYHKDHFGSARELVPLSQIVYDHGDNIERKHRNNYMNIVEKPEVDRREITCDYQETFSGGVNIECVAVNQATDFDLDFKPSSSNDNSNSIALLITFNDFDYFTGGDLTSKAEKSLAKGIKNCDAYHVNHHGSSSSSVIDFIEKLDPEVSIASNGTKHGHPTKKVAGRLLGIESKFYQTNV